MFRASSCPSSGATTAVAASGLRSELGGSSAVGRGRSGRPDHDQQRARACVCVCVCHSQKSNIYWKRCHGKTKQRVRCTIALQTRISLPIRKHTQSSRTQPGNFCPIWTGVSPDFLKKSPPQKKYQISRKSVRWEPGDIQADGRTWRS
jgi:hypothetical protein